MGDTLLGKEVSGTPLETRGATSQFAGLISRAMGGDKGALSPFTGLTTDALMSILSNPQIISALVDPNDIVKGLFRLMPGFEAEETNRQVGGVRNIFGSVGGRFGSGVGSAEAMTRGQLGNQFAKARYDALLEASGQRNQLLSSLVGSATQTGSSTLDAITRFLAPGVPQYQQGILPGLLSAGASIYGASMFKPVADIATRALAGGGGSTSMWNTMIRPRLTPQSIFRTVNPVRGY